MSGSETGVMTSTARDPFGGGGVGLQKSPVTIQPVIQNMRLAFSSDGTAVYKPVTAATSPPSYPSTAVGGGGVDLSPGSGPAIPSNHGINVNIGKAVDSLKRKRGRPRKYGPDGTMALALVSPASANQTQSVTVTQPTGGGGGGGGGGGISSPPPPPAAAPTSQPPTVASSAPPPPPAAAAAISAPVAVTDPLPSERSEFSPPGIKKARGRPPGSTNTKRLHHQLDTLGSAGVGFTPHIITVKAGEDVSNKIMSFTHNGPRAVCILSANGAISNVTLRQPATSGGTVTYEGRFEILSMSGSFLPSENGGQKSRTGGLSLSLSGPDGRVLGGSVAGLLTAATPVQVVVASFLAEGHKESKSANQNEPFTSLNRLNQAVGTTGQNSPPSRGALSESSGGHGSPLNQSTGACNNSHPQGFSGMPWK